MLAPEKRSRRFLRLTGWCHLAVLLLYSYVQRGFVGGGKLTKSDCQDGSNLS